MPYNAPEEDKRPEILTFSSRLSTLVRNVFPQSRGGEILSLGALWDTDERGLA